jgi:hypothetical protein
VGGDDVLTILDQPNEVVELLSMALLAQLLGVVLRWFLEGEGWECALVTLDL